MSREQKLLLSNMQLVRGINILEMNKFTENEWLPNFELKWKPFTLKTTRKRIDFERVSIVCALLLLTKTENV